MLERLRRLLEGRLRPALEAPERADEQALRLAAAALLVEVARADYDVDPGELETVEDAVREAFGLDAESAEALVAMARAEAEDAVSLHQFTSEINRRFDPAAKRRLVELLWRVAFADGRLDRYEEHLIRRVADLLHLPHRDFIRAKLRAQGEGT